MKRLPFRVRLRGDFLLLVVLTVLFAALSNGATLGADNLGNLARQVALNAPVAMGQMLVLLVAGMDLSVGAVLAMASALAVGLQSIGMWPAILAAVLFGLAIGTVNGLLVTRAGVNPFIVTLGTMNLLTGALLTYTGQRPIAGRIPEFASFGAGSIGPVPTPVVVIAILAAALHVLLRYTRPGRNIYAVGGNPEAAFVSGIDVRRYRLLAYVLGGGLAAIAGVLLASSLNSGSVQVGNNAFVTSVAACIIGGASLFGGRGGVGGALIGITILGIVANGMNALGIYTYYQVGVTAVILIGVVVFDAFSTRLGREALRAMIQRARWWRREHGVRSTIT